MPDLNGTVVVMKCADVSELEQFLCFLPLQLNQVINLSYFFSVRISSQQSIQISSAHFPHNTNPIHFYFLYIS